MRRPQERGLSIWNEPEMLAGSPWQMMRRMQEDMDRLFGQFFGGPAGSPGGGMTPASQQGAMQQWAPSVDISQNEREWCIEAELPGVNKDDIDVQVQDHHLILSAAMRRESGTPEGEGDQRQYHHRERRYGYFQRVIPLPENVSEDQISCQFRNGVLEVHVPKAQQAQPRARRIQVMDVPAETAGGRTRSQAEIGMTREGPGQVGERDGDLKAQTPGMDASPRGAQNAAEEEEEPAMAGAKGGTKSNSRSRKKAAS